MLLVLTVSFYFDVNQLGKEKYGDLQVVELGRAGWRRCSILIHVIILVASLDDGGIMIESGLWLRPLG